MGACGVRKGRGDAAAETSEDGTLPFSTHLFPLVNHPAVKKMGPSVVRFLLAQRLYEYFNGTVCIEKDVIVPTVNAIADDRFSLSAGPDLTEDALKIGVDEYFHTLEAVQTKRKVVDAIGIAPLRSQARPPFLRQLEQMVDDAVPEERAVV